MTDIKRQRAFFKDLKEIYTLLKEAPQQNKKIRRAARVVGKGLVITKEQLKEQIELAKKEAKEEENSATFGSLGHDFENEKTGRSIKSEINLDEMEASVEVEEDSGVAYTAQLSKKGIVLGASKTLAKVEMKPKEMKLGFINFELKAEASATLAIGHQLLTDKIGVDARLDLHAELELEAYISILKLLEFGGSVTFNADASLSASIEIAKEKGLVKVNPLTVSANAEFEIFLRPSDEILEIAETICEFLKVDGKDEHEFKKDQLAWVIPLGSVNILELELPGFEFEFDAPAQVEPSFDFLSILEKEKNNLGGFPGTIVTIVDAINDVFDFLDDVWDDIGEFFDELGERFEKAAIQFIGQINPALGKELRQQQQQEAINKLKSAQMAIIFGAAIEKMKKKPHHMRELYKLKKKDEKNWYVFMEVWPEVMSDKFIVESILAMGNDDVVLLEKNSRISQAKFTIEKYDIDGPKVDGSHVMGEYITVALDVRKDEAWVQEIKNSLLKGSDFDTKMNARVEAILMCGTEEVDKKVIAVSELIENDVPMNNAYTLKLLPVVGAYCNTPRQLANSNSPEQENWSIKVRLDFVGDIMDITAEYPIEMTYQQVQDQSMPELQQSILYPEVQGISIKGEKEGKYFVQGTPIDVKTKIGIEMLPPEVAFLKGTVIVAVTCNKKLVHSKAKAHFKLVDHENPMNLVNVPVHLPFGFDETAMGGDWLVHIHVKMEGMETIKKARRIAVVNPNRDYSIGDGGKSWVSEDK